MEANPESSIPIPRSFKITNAMLEKYGYTEFCPKCTNIQRGDDGSRASRTMYGASAHSPACRLRLQAEMEADPEDRERVEERERRREHRGQGKEEACI